MLYLLKIILAFVFPPFSVLIQVGFGINFWINILLTLIGWIPGIIHAFLVMSLTTNNKNLQHLELENDKLQKQLDKQRRQLLEEKAKQFLKNLNPKSGDAIWFKEFSKNYDSPLKAAIDYLQTIKETPSS